MHPARKAASLMWLTSAAAMLMGCLFALFPTVLDLIAQNKIPDASAADVQQAREMIRKTEAQRQGVSLATVVKVVGLIMIAGGLITAVLAIFVWAGSRVATIISGVLTGLIGAYWVLQVISAVAVGGPGAVAFVLFAMGVVAVLFIQLKWLRQAAMSEVGPSPRPVGPAAAYPPAYPNPFPSTQPPMGEPIPPMAAQGPTGPTPGSMPQSFSPAPFGIPPPPDELPPGQYGYAQRPKG